MVTSTPHAKTIKSATFIDNCTNPNYNNTLIIMLLLSIFLSLSVAAIPLGPHSTRQSPSLMKGLPALPALPALPLPDPAQLLQTGKLLGRFIMDADYSSGSSPPAFFGKSPHKRADPLSNMFDSTTLRYNDVKEEIPPPNFA